MDTVEASYSKKEIAPELSDLVVYTETKKFTGFKVSLLLLDGVGWGGWVGGCHSRLLAQAPKHPVMRCTEMYSISEASAKKATRKNPLELYQ